MSLHPQPSTPVPPQTRQIAQAAFPRGNRYLQLRDTLGTLYDDALFADLFPQRGQAAQAPWQLALVTLLQFAENLSDRQAADAVRSRLDWKYLLGLELTDPGFDFSVLSEFRQRLVAAKAEERLLTHLLMCCQDQQWLKAGGKQRTDSTHVLARVRDMNRLECVGETMRFTLNRLATLLPDWLARQLPPEWAARYGSRVEEYRLPHTKPQREAYAQQVGQDGWWLLERIEQDEQAALLWQLPAIDILRRVWIQQFRLVDDQLVWRVENQQTKRIWLACHQQSFAGMSLLLHLAEVPDFRQPGRNFRHPLLSILVISVLAVLCGADDFEDIADFGQQKQVPLTRHLALPHGVPSADTFRRVFQHLDAAAFNAAFLNWVRQLLPAPVAAQVCVDGQTLRGSGPQALHVVSALARAEGLCLAQVATSGKGQELAAIPDVLALLDLSGGALVSLDALGCQPAIAAQIVHQGGHYLLALKQNQPTLCAEAERALAGVRPQAEATGWASHNTPVRWQVAVQTDLRWVNEDGRWPHLAALVRVETLRYPAAGPPQVQAPRYYLSSQPALTAEQALTAVRGHWAVENQLHWHLDVTLRQDAHRLRDERAAENLALVRKMALNLLRADSAPGSLKVKRKRLGWSDTHLEALLTQIAKCV